MTDSELISGCILGDKKCWDAFVERFSRLIYGCIRKTLERSSFRDRKEIAGDVFQQVFERLLDKDRLVRLKNADHAGKFLTVMASRVAVDKIRHLARTEKRNASFLFETDPFEFVEDTAKDPAASAVSKEERLIFEGILESLSWKERVCIECHYVDGKGHREIADFLGMSQDYVSTIIRRTRERIKVKLLQKGVEGV